MGLIIFVAIPTSVIKSQDTEVVPEHIRMDAYV